MPPATCLCMQCNLTSLRSTYFLSLYCHRFANTIKYYALRIEYCVLTITYEVTLVCTLAHMHSKEVVVLLVDGVVLLVEQRGLPVV